MKQKIKYIYLQKITKDKYSIQFHRGLSYRAYYVPSWDYGLRLLQMIIDDMRHYSRNISTFVYFALENPLIRYTIT